MSSAGEAVRPDFLSYHRSLQAELDAIRDRVRSLIQHWPTDGAFKEAVLRNVIRRHLPEPLFVGTGFVVTQEARSSQIDILVVDKSLPTLFQDGDLVIVTVDAARAAVEVKTSLNGQQGLYGAFAKLASNGALCSQYRNLVPRPLWTGLFVYDAAPNQEGNLLRALRSAADEKGVRVDCVAYGSDVLISFVTKHQVMQDGNGWICCNMPGLAPALFLSLLLNHFAQPSVFFDRTAWFPPQAADRPPLFIRADDGADVQEFPSLRPPEESA